MRQIVQSYSKTTLEVKTEQHVLNVHAVRTSVAYVKRPVDSFAAGREAVISIEIVCSRVLVFHKFTRSPLQEHEHRRQYAALCGSVIYFGGVAHSPFTAKYHPLS